MDNSTIIITVVLILGGLFSVICALKDFDWFMNNSRAALIVRILGRGGARVFYVLLGAAFIIFGLYGLFVNPSLFSR
jgi:hypothetical protein